MPDHPEPSDRSAPGDAAFAVELEQALAEQQAVPRRVLEAGYAAFAWRTIDAELAELLYDSASQSPTLAGARSDQANVRAMTFASEAVTIELELNADELLGQISPARAREVVVVVDGEPTVRVPLAEVGSFRIRPVPTGSFRLRFEGDEPVVQTGPISF